MDKEQKKQFADEVDKAVMDSVKDYPMWRRAHWDEWGSPVGLTIAWAPGLICIGVFLYFLHLAEII